MNQQDPTIAYLMSLYQQPQSSILSMPPAQPLAAPAKPEKKGGFDLSSIMGMMGGGSGGGGGGASAMGGMMA